MDPTLKLLAFLILVLGMFLLFKVFHILFFAGHSAFTSCLFVSVLANICPIKSDFSHCEKVVKNWAFSSLQQRVKEDRHTLRDLLFFLHVPRTGGRTYFHWYFLYGTSHFDHIRGLTYGSTTLCFVLAVSWKGCTLMLKNAPVLMISYGLIQGITFLFSNSLFLIILVFHLFAQPNVQFFYGCYW